MNNDASCWYAIAYRTPIQPFREPAASHLSLNDMLAPVLEFVDGIVGKDLRIRQLFFGSCFSEEIVRSYTFRRVLCDYPRICEKAANANICYIDSACLSAFTSLLLTSNRSLANGEIDVYFGYEDLACGQKELFRAATSSPEKLETQDICRRIAQKYGISVSMAREYIREQVKLKRAAYPAILSHIFLDHTTGTEINADDLHTANLLDAIQTKDDLGRPPYLARFSKGAGVIVCTSSRELYNQHRGLRIHSISSHCAIGDATSNHHILQSMELALVKAGLSWHDVSAIEIYDGFLTLTLSVVETLKSQLRPEIIKGINRLGNAIVHGDPVSAVGILMLTNVESMFHANLIPDDGYVLLTDYSTTVAISLVVSRT